MQQAAAAAIKEKGSFTLVLSGGSLLKGLSALVGSKSMDYSKWHIFYVDERNVPHSHIDSTHKGAVEAFSSKVDIPQQQVGWACSAARLHEVLQGINRFWVCLQCFTPRDMPTPENSTSCCCSAAGAQWSSYWSVLSDRRLMHCRQPVLDDGSRPSNHNCLCCCRCTPSRRACL